MNTKHLELIYKYMEEAKWNNKPYKIIEWEYYHFNTPHWTTLDPEDGTEGQERIIHPKPKLLDSNACWECVQEMINKSDYITFFEFAKRQVDFVVASVDFSFYLWLMNPTNFFSCMGAWLEEIEVRK